MRVLIADDEPLARERLAALVGDSGNEVVASVENGELAVDAAERLRPDVCLLDIRMPGLDGISAARRIRELDWSTAPLGAPSSWPEALRAALGTILGAPIPLTLLWGEDLTTFYNDAQLPLAPGPIGARGADLRVWDVLGPSVLAVRARGTSVKLRDVALTVERGGEPIAIRARCGYG